MTSILLHAMLMVVVALMPWGCDCVPAEPMRIALTDVSIQSGVPPTLDACSDPARCIGGLASVAALLRRRYGVNNPNLVFIPTLDMFSAFVQVHPKGLGINAGVLQKFGISHYILWHPSSLAHDDAPRFPELESSNPSILYTNAFFSPAWHLYGFPIQWVYGSQAAIGALVYPGAFGSADAAKTYKEARARRQDNLPTVIIARFLTQDELLALSQLPDPPQLVIVEGISSGVPPDANTTTGLATMGRMPVVYCPVDDRYTVGTVTVSFDGRDLVSAACRIDPVAVDPVYHDQQYHEHQAYLLAEAAVATQHDRAVGYFMDLMPPTFDHQADDPFNNMVCDAFLWESGADIAFLNGGAIMGPGFPATAVRIGDIYGHFPWPDAMCRGTFTGAHIFELVNMFVMHETNPNTLYFNFSYGGLRLHYDVSREPSQRLTSIDVRSRTTGAYAPLNRRAMYTWVTLDYACLSMHAMATNAFKPKYRGETAVPQDSTVAQIIIAKFINVSSPLMASKYMGHRKLPAAPGSPAMATTWNQSQDACTGVWHADIGTCEVSHGDGNTTFSIILIAVAVAAVCLLSGITITILRALSVNGARNIRNAPTTNPVCIMCMDVEKSTHLWSAVPHSMQRAVDMHFTMVHQLIEKHKAYEVKTIGDAFMIATRSPDVAVALANDIQATSQKTRWPKAIANAYDAFQREEEYAAGHADHMCDVLRDVPDDLVSQNPLKNGSGGLISGLRIRIGVHVGTCDIRFDAVAKSHDYFGPAVNCASLVESKAQGGQTLISMAVKEALTSTTGMHLKELGRMRLRYIQNPVEVFEVLPDELAYRSAVFPAPFEDDTRLRSASLRLHNDQTSGPQLPAACDGPLSTAAELTTPFSLLLRQTVPAKDAKRVEKAVWALAGHISRLLRPLRPHEKDDMFRRLFTAWRLPPQHLGDADTALAMLCLRSAGPQRPRSQRPRSHHPDDS